MFSLYFLVHTDFYTSYQNPTKRSALTNEPRAQDDLTGAEDEIEDNNEPVDTEEPMLGEEDEIRKIDSGYFTSKEALIKQFDFVKVCDLHICTNCTHNIFSFLLVVFVEF